VPALFDGRIDLAIVSNDDHDDRPLRPAVSRTSWFALLRPIIRSTLSRSSPRPTSRSALFVYLLAAE